MTTTCQQVIIQNCNAHVKFNQNYSNVTRGCESPNLFDFESSKGVNNHLETAVEGNILFMCLFRYLLRNNDDWLASVL